MSESLSDIFRIFLNGQPFPPSLLPSLPPSLPTYLEVRHGHVPEQSKLLLHGVILEVILAATA